MCNNLENPFSYFLTSKDSLNLKRCIYLSPEDVTDKLSGGHIEAITDSYYLSFIFSEVVLAYPIQAIDDSTNSLLNLVLSRRKNIRLEPVATKSGFLQMFFLATNRLNFNNLKNSIKSNPKDIFIVGCHRNLLPQIELFLCYGLNNLYFKSYGTIFLHNLSNIKSVVLTNFNDKLFYKRIVSTFFYLLFENLSYVLSNKTFMTRHKLNVTNNILGKLFHVLFNKRLIYSASGPYWFFKEKNLKEKTLNYNKQLNNKILLGSLGDNTFPTSVLGLKSLINDLRNSNENFNFKIDIQIAGKINPFVESILNKTVFGDENIKLIFLGYIENKEEFYNSLDALLIPVSGGSAMPIKALESVISYSGPVLGTNYIYDSCSHLINYRSNIFYSPLKFLSSFNSNK